MATQITTAYRFHKLERETIVLNQPTLKPPVISITGELLNIIDSRNGEFVKFYQIYANDNKFITTESLNLDFNNVQFPDGMIDVDISVKSCGEFFNDSDYSNTTLLRRKGYSKDGSTISIYSDITEQSYDLFPGASWAYIN